MASAIALCMAIFSVPKVQSSPSLKLISAQEIDLVDGSGNVLASLGHTSDGNVLTFFDSTGKKTLTLGDAANESAAGLTTWDNNKVIAGNGIVRSFSGENSTGFGGCIGIGANGASSGIGVLSSTFEGYFANDGNGTLRQLGGITLDGTFNIWRLIDPNGMLRVGAIQVPPGTETGPNRQGNGFAVFDSHQMQEASMAAFADGSLAGFNVVDTANIDRFSAYLDQTGMNLKIRDANGNVLTHLP